MQILDRRQLNNEIGKNAVFKSYTSLHEKLRYVSGIAGFDSLPQKHKQGNVISFIGHPEGIEIRENASGSKTALSYDKIKSWDIIAYKEDRHYLHVHLEHQKDLVFNFLVNKGGDVATYFKTLNIDRFKEERTEEQIREQIGQLRSAYDLPSNYHVNFSQEFKTGALVKIKRIEIEDNRISWAGEAFTLDRCTGITYSKTKNSVHGIKTSMEYQIHVHIEGEKKPLKIVFGKSFGLGEKEAELFYNNILDALYNLVTRKKIQSWLTAFEKNEKVDCGQFKLSRSGIHHVRRGENKVIKWEDVHLKNFEMNITFKSSWEKRNSIVLGLTYDENAWALSSFCEYLGNENNLLFLTG
ncbi:MAG: hypothetical protein ACI857_001065 [Arenicella sp.]|jgi:hypothetical protein